MDLRDFTPVGPDMNFTSADLRHGFLGIFICMLSVCQAQDTFLLQPELVPTTMNPGFSGAESGTQVNTCYFHQGTASSDANRTALVSLDHRLDSTGWGLGLVYMNDKTGSLLTTNSIQLMSSYGLIDNGQHALRLGFSAGLFQEYLAWSNLTFGDMIDPNQGFVYETQEEDPGKNYFASLSTGLTYTRSRLSLGASVWHLNRPNVSLVGGEARLPIRWMGHASFNIPVIQKADEANVLSLSPGVIYNQQGESSMLRISTDVSILKRAHLHFFSPSFNGTSRWWGVGGSVQLGMVALNYGYGDASSGLVSMSKMHQVSIGLSLGQGSGKSPADS